MMLLIALLLGLNTQAGIGTVFSSVDEGNPNPSLACKKGILRDTDMYVAHRELPCKSKVVVCNTRTNLCTSATVMDRGPFGVIGKSYTSVIDLTPAVAEKIGHNGFENVIVISDNPIPNSKPKPKKKYERRNS